LLNSQKMRFIHCHLNLRIIELSYSLCRQRPARRNPRHAKHAGEKTFKG
jgi:hypothetical protein